MYQKANNNQTSNSKVFKQLSLMMFLTVLTQAIMLIKSSIVALNFGVSIEMDAFNLANNIGIFIYSFIGAGVTTVLIPTLINNEDREGINIFVSVLYTSAFILLIVVQIFKKPIINILSTGRNEFIVITSNIMLVTLITQYIQSFMGTTDAIFQCSGRFNIPKLITLLNSIVLVILLLFIKNITIYKYTFLILISTIINVLIHIYLAIKGGYNFSYKLDIKNKKFIEMMKVFMPTVLSTGLYQVSLLIDSMISSRLGTGSRSKLSYSNNIMIIINTVILSNVMTYFYPKIAGEINKDNGQNKLFDLSILINCIMILIVVGFVLVGKNGIAILYQRGKFTEDITEIVYICTLIYIIGIPSNAFRDLIYRYFYANSDTLTPFKNSIIISCLNIGVSIILAKYIGLYGIILGTVITSFISLSMILFRFNKKFKFKYDIKILINENIKLIASAVITIVIVLLFKYILPQFNILTSILFYGFMSVILYVALIYILKSKVFNVKLVY